MNTFIEIPANKRSLARRALTHGVGVNDASYMIHIKDSNGNVKECPFYNRWHSMMQRCYSDVWHKRSPSYLKCEIVVEWHLFSNFKRWMEAQDWEGKELDKDVKVVGNKIYGPETCLFVPSKINKLLTNNAARRGKYPVGVSLDKDTNKFIAYCRINSNRKNLGRFNTPEDAHSAYKAFKKNLIEYNANLPENEYIRKHLLNHAALLN